VVDADAEIAPVELMGVDGVLRDEELLLVVGRREPVLAPEISLVETSVGGGEPLDGESLLLVVGGDTSV
jgi:hypothetical protein